MSDIGALLLFAILLVYVYLHSVERKKRRDCHTDLSQLLHDERIDKDDLRRSSDHKELQRWFDDE